MTRTLRYLQQNSTQTLREGVEEYLTTVPGLKTPSDFAERRTYDQFMLHDVTHVVFGCDTSVRGEALLDTWTVFGSSVPFREYLGFLKFPETHVIASEAGGYPKIALIGLVNLPDLVRALLRAKRMTRRWPWRGFEKHLDRPLVEIRDEFNIRVIP